MTVLDRQGRPATLQVDAIGRRLTGAPMVAEVVRYLSSEFPHFEGLSVYRKEGTELIPLSAEEDSFRQPPPSLGPGFEGLTVRAPMAPGSAPAPSPTDPRGPRPWLIVPVRAGPELLGAVVARGNPGAAFDASDRRFLEGVATRLGPALSAPVGSRLL
jgi:hypothetical protein